MFRKGENGMKTTGRVAIIKTAVVVMILVSRQATQGNIYQGSSGPYRNEHTDSRPLTGLVPIQRILSAVSIAQSAQAERVASRKIQFSGYTWQLKTGRQSINGLKRNYFSDSEDNVWVDDKGQLHLKITKRNGRWYCAEVASEKSFGYGKYIFYLQSPADQFADNVVLGLFTWGSSPRYSHREIDIEFSRWGKPEGKNAQFVVQPGTQPGNTHWFNIKLEENHSTHSFEWRRDSIFFQSLRGHYPSPPDGSYIIQSWSYTGKNNPRPGDEKARIDLWLSNAKPPSDNAEVEVVIKKFEFIPLVSRAVVELGREDDQTLAGSYPNQKNALDAQIRLQAAGYFTYVTEVEVGGKGLTRVIVDVDGSKQEIENVGEELVQKGLIGEYDPIEETNVKRSRAL